VFKEHFLDPAYQILAQVQRPFGLHTLVNVFGSDVVADFLVQFPIRTEVVAESHRAGHTSRILYEGLA
jgi:hypothetical protein